MANIKRGKNDIDANFKDSVKKLYNDPITSTRGGSIFNAHSYPTKINYEAVLACIMAHTEPNDIVFDGFSGSGVTGLAAKLCDNPDEDIKRKIENKLGELRWGPRNAVLYDINSLAAFISRTLTDPPNPNEFNEAANELIEYLNDNWGWMYEALDLQYNKGKIRYIIWSEHIICSYCNNKFSFWDIAVEMEKPEIKSSAKCFNCNKNFKVNDAERVKEKYYDEILKENRKRRLRTPVYLFGKTENKYWERPIKEKDLNLIERIDNLSIPSNVPVVKMMETEDNNWGELHRNGYHFGITHLHQFYTKRNLIALSHAYKKAKEYNKKIRDGLLFLISSYNSSHSTLMSRVVAKKSSNKFVITGAQPKTLYISSLPAEKNIFEGLKNKLTTIVKAFDEVNKKKGKVFSFNKSTLNVNLPDNSIDYVFVDPPFGGNIQYAENNFINEAWLGDITDINEEIIMSKKQNKSIIEYKSLLSGAFYELYRILKPGKYATVVFNSTDHKIWNALQEAWEKAGFQLKMASILDKDQETLKQIKSEGAVKGDPLILLQKPRNYNENTINDNIEVNTVNVIERMLKNTKKDNFEERTKERLYSRFINYCLINRYKLDVSAKTFYKILEENFICRNKSFFLKED